MKSDDRDRGFAVFPGWALPLLAPAYYEAMLHLWTQDTFVPARFVTVLAFGLGLGGILTLIYSLLPPKGRKWTAGIVTAVLAILYGAQFFMDDAYQSFMTLPTILAGAGGVVTGFLDIVLLQLAKNWWRVALLLLPLGLLPLSKPLKLRRKGILAAVLVLGYALGFGVIFAAGTDVPRLGERYHFDRAVRAFGLHVSLALEGIHGGDRADTQFQVVTEPSTEATVPSQAPTEPTEAPSQATEPPTEAPTEPPVVYGVNSLPMDFAALAQSEQNENIAAIHSYVASLSPASQNAYTGIFAGKNLIFITAEAFSAEVIDPVLTPTLYRLATQGIDFTDYYQPDWGCSTTGGEFSNLLSLIPRNGDCMMEATEQDFFLTLGRQLQRQGYATAAFHNNSYTYYSRHRTHPCLGYDLFMGQRNGMEQGVADVWPQSDREMMDFTLPMYLENQPFHLYYMSVSGHATYSQDGNNMSRRNYDAVAQLDCSETVKCYLAANLELEYALQSLVTQLEEAGILADTVIVVATDHYPYGLEKSSAWGNTQDYLAELYGFDSTGNKNRDHSDLILWCADLEGLGIRVDTPVSSLDILPTLSNLFGLPYDSRLMLGRDVFSGEMPLVQWADGSWLTEKGYFDADSGVFTPTGPVEEGYVEYVSTLVANRAAFSAAVQRYEYFNFLPQR